jgi:hypothetical protein
VPAETTAALENEKADNAFHVIEKKLLPSVKGAKRTASATAWQERLFSLASDFNSEMTFEVTGQQGRGNSQVTRHQVSIETEQGQLLVKLTKPFVPPVEETK